MIEWALFGSPLPLLLLLLGNICIQSALGGGHWKYLGDTVLVVYCLEMEFHQLGCHHHLPQKN